MTNTAAAKSVALVVGDDVLYVGSMAQQWGVYCVTAVHPVPAMHLAALAEGVDVNRFGEAYRYTIENVSRGVRLENVRRQSLLLDGVEA